MSHLRTITSALALAACALTASATCNGVASSASYCMQQTTLNGGGGTSVSPVGTNFRLSASIGQESVIGVSSSPNYVLQSGFWSYQGSGLVPVLLTLNKSASPNFYPVLNWTGNNSPYSVYRVGNACNTVFANFLTSQTPQSYTETAGVAGPLTCYNILATAPGPVPPPSSTADGMISPSASGTLDPVSAPPPSR